ncbi:MAG: ABC-2 family transporter protein, partial [Chloroflexia bacterium]|nr:ABC-2 family transporter protein [Chloroflexia bacterium]
LFAGTMVPLWFYPDGLRTLANVLPFQFLAFFPAATWMGELSGPEIGRNLALGLAWATALLGSCWWLWSRIVRRLVIQGG